MPGDTLVEILALSSPSGRMSKRARAAAQERIRHELFDDLPPYEPPPAPPAWETLRRQAKELRNVAARGMKPRAYRKRADELDAQANELERQSQNA